MNNLPSLCDFGPELSSLSTAFHQPTGLPESGHEPHGAIFTRREVADFILDLVGFTPDHPLHEMRLLEPSFGAGDFLLPAIERLFTAYDRAGRPGTPATALANAIRGVELHERTFAATKARVVALLASLGLSLRESETLSERWLVHADFLLHEEPGCFSHVVGNPPYVRQELIPAPRIAEYRRRYATIFDRADLYVPFIERSLSLLEARGVLGFICADRWMKNRYGGPLRQFICDGGFHLKVHVDMVGTDAFQSEVAAYPAIFVIGREGGQATRTATEPSLVPASLALLAEGLKGRTPHPGVTELAGVVRRAEPWIFEDAAELSLVRRLELIFPTIEEAGCKVGIGVATGADKIFVGDYEALDVEPERKLPLAVTRDLAGGVVQWQGRGVINPFAEDGSLVDLDVSPRLGRYLKAHEEKLRQRHVSKNNPNGWYRTIDRIWPKLTERPKLLIPDIKNHAQIVYEGGGLYPHHNLYYIVSDAWDLHALQAVLKSGIARLFVAAYSTKMRGGFLRFQAQYIRRIRLPYWHDVPQEIRRTLTDAGRRFDHQTAMQATCELFALSSNEAQLLQKGED